MHVCLHSAHDKRSTIFLVVLACGEEESEQQRPARRCDVRRDVAATAPPEPPEVRSVLLLAIGPAPRSRAFRRLPGPPSSAHLLVEDGLGLATIA